MVLLKHQVGDKILYVAPATVNQQELLQSKESSQAQVGDQGVVAFEVLDRVADAPLTKSSFQAIYSNSFQPTISTHTTDMISRFLGSLASGGRLELCEPVLIADLSNSVSPLHRKQDDLVSMLKLAGFVNVQATTTPITDDTLQAMFQLWGGNANRVDQGVKRLSGKFGLTHIQAEKPKYEVGQKMMLNFGKKKTTAEKKKVWTIANDDDMEDDDMLLDEEDKAKPSKESLVRPDDCEMEGGRRKACKNCTCGRAEGEAAGVVDPTPKKVGGCGSCALGDAFRCSTCPYLGMPAFNEGEKVVLGGMFGQDDI
ncbi:DUF689-domain-containing protein [Hesseltinella vesiculosa]|uniref:DUF689-domain-containing protein n=1 Tax=Hesseltinella vesiculosa TaxID=101127 RepID=A0A1X2GMS5_9FUNG|nr:DUF689-domain-containing protein [Hesseltinella vesiculosa]